MQVEGDRALARRFEGLLEFQAGPHSFAGRPAEGQLVGAE